ncbi:MAG: T6SS immunity protein Tli4 family protein, partial [Smithellaceae bacterium]
MTRIIRSLLLAVLIGVILCGASDAATKKSGKSMQETKGAQHKMKSYYMGRFAIDLPAEFKLEIQSQKVRYAEISDFKWKERDRDKERNTLWAQKIAEIKRLKVPKDKKQIIIEEKHLKGIGVWAKAVEYYGDYRIGKYIYWSILVDYGEAGIWLTLYGLNNDKTIKNFTNILKHYRYGFSELTKDSFCLNHGRVELPYMEQEGTYSRFAGPMGMKLEIDMNETHKVEETGLLESFAASLATNFAPGVDVDKIRTNKRKVAGLPGEELVTRLTADMGPELYFGWKYLGKE